MKFENFIALRYILGKRSLNIITVITFISILGITTGVAVIIVVMSIFNGFRDFTEGQILQHDPHVRIIPESDMDISNNSKLVSFLDNEPEIIDYSPVFSDRTAILHEGNMIIAEINAVPIDNLSYLDSFHSFVVIGGLEFNPGSQIPGVIVGVGIAETLSLYPGDTLALISPEMIEISLRSFRRVPPVKVLVNGIFQTNNPKYDQNMLIGAKSVVDGLANKHNNANFVDIKIKDPYDHAELQSKIESNFPGLKTISWKNINVELYNVMRFEQLAAFVILSIIILIAVFNVLASLTMSVIDKKSDIGILKAIGANKEGITRIFRNVGLFSGVFSTVLGTALGLFLCYGQINFKWFKVDTSKFIIDAIPVKIDYFYVLIVIITSIVLSVIATIYPSKRAAKTNILNALRSE